MTQSRRRRNTAGIYSKFKQVITKARIVKIVVEEPAKLMEHPLESGAVVVDHRIILPIKIEVSTILEAKDYRDVYRELKQLFLNGTTLSVQTKSDVYTNQIIAEMPHEEDPAMFDALAVAIKFKQILFASTQVTISPQSPIDSTTVNRGQVSPSQAGSATGLNGVIS